MRIHSVAVSAIVLVCAAAAGAEEIGAGPAPVIGGITTSPGVVRVNLESAGEATVARPQLRFLILPPGVARARLEPAGGRENTALQAVVGEPVILRGLRVAPVVFSCAAGFPGLAY